MTIQKISASRGRKRDVVRDHFLTNGKFSICKYCNKRFSSAVTLSLKGHLAGGVYSKEQKTRHCTNVPTHLQEYYTDSLKNRKRSCKKEKITRLKSKDSAENWEIKNSTVCDVESTDTRVLSIDVTIHQQMIFQLQLQWEMSWTIYI
jgi:hypothetical protein